LPEVTDRPYAPGLEHRGRGVIARVDRVADPAGRKPGQQAGRPLLGQVQERGADAPPPVRGVDDPPAFNDGPFLLHGLHVPNDRPRAVGHHPGVGGEIEAHPVPLVADEVRAQNDLPGLGELVGDEHVGHRVEVAGKRRPEPVSGGDFHVPERTAGRTGRSELCRWRLGEGGCAAG
jgi:hypothetical protein